MTYEVYIKKDYKPVVRSVNADSPRGYRSQRRWFILLLLAVVVVSFIVWSKTYSPFMFADAPQSDKQNNVISTNQSAEEIPGSVGDITEAVFHKQHDETEMAHAGVANNDPATTDIETTPPEPEWQTVLVKPGDSLSLVFDRMHITPQALYKIVTISDETKILKDIKPNQELRFRFEDDRLTGFEYDINLTDTLRVTRNGDGFEAETITTDLETRVSVASGVIKHSLFLAAQRAGLSDNLTMQLISLYGWDIDFVLDIRQNDQFHVIYEEHYKDGVKVRDGQILAAEFVNRDKPIRAVRYEHDDGHVDYYSEDGFSMRKAFLRTPVDFRRISSGFSLARKHPVLNTIRAHKGVDYAARSGTPVKATGDGVVAFAGTKGGYGRVITLRHGGKYSTLYAHLSKYARDIHTGKRVKQGQIIGYVGMSGLATGPHLHYEFRIHGVHHNPLTVELPKAMRVPDTELPHFRKQTRQLLAELDTLSNETIIAEESEQDAALVALNEDSEAATPSNN